MRRVQSLSWLTILLILPLAGCATLAEKEATHLANRDLALAGDIRLIPGDLALFRQCFARRGGSCRGDASTALPHTSQAAAGHPVGPATHGSSNLLSTAVSNLPPGHPAKDAYAALGHSVTLKARSLHDHLRGHDSGGVPGFRVEPDGARGSLVHLGMGFREIGGFARLLFGSVGGRGFTRLHELCDALKKHAADKEPGGAGAGTLERQALERECRPAAFAHQYLSAYFRHGEILELDVDTSGVIADLDSLDAKVDQEIGDIESETGTRIDDLASSLTAKINQRLTDKANELDAKIKRDDPAAPPVAGPLADALQKEIGQLVTTETGALKSSLLGIEPEVLTPIQEAADKADKALEESIESGTDSVNQALGKVSRVSNVGFVSRDTTWQAKVPSFEVTLDPTASRLVTVTDLDSGQVVTGKTRFEQLGVMNGKSGASIGAELVRVFLEALFDAHEGLPALAPKNAPHATGLGVGPWSLPAFDPPMGDVSSADWNDMVQINSQVATNVEAVLTRIVAGIGPLSLNNPALEELIVEILTTSARKAAEKATWCWYACDLDVAVKKTETDVKALLDKEEEKAADKITQTVDKAGKAVADEEKKGLDKVEGFVHHVAEEVRLRLRLHDRGPEAGSSP